MAGIYFHAANSTPPAIGGIDANTVLMLHMDGDQSDSQHVVTANGNPQFSTAQSKFGGSSMLFDGSGDYLTVPTSVDFTQGTGDYTIDFWIYLPTALSDGVYWPIYDRETSGDDFENIIVYQTSGTIKIGWACFIGNSAQFNIEPVVSLPEDTWHHIACVRESNVHTIYLNGVAQTPTPTWTGSMLQFGTTYIGYRAYAGNYFNGHVEELRYSDTARWSAGFTPPTSAHISDANTKLLLHMNGDVSDSAHVVTSNGNPQLNATTAKFDGAMYFDGTNDYLTAPISADFQFPDDFTVDFWVNFSTYKTYQGTVGTASNGGSATGWWIEFGSARGFTFAHNNAIRLTDNVIDLTGLSTGVWYHVALVRNGSGANNLKVYVDGVLSGQVTYTANIDSVEDLLIAEYSHAHTVDRLHGYLDEVRISKGIARWTSNFTPESGPYTE